MADELTDEGAAVAIEALLVAFNWLALLKLPPNGYGSMQITEADLSAVEIDMAGYVRLDLSATGWSADVGTNFVSYKNTNEIVSLAPVTGPSQTAEYFAICQDQSDIGGDVLAVGPLPVPLVIEADQLISIQPEKLNIIVTRGAG